MGGKRKMGSRARGHRSRGRHPYDTGYHFFDFYDDCDDDEDDGPIFVFEDMDFMARGRPYHSSSGWSLSRWWPEVLLYFKALMRTLFPTNAEKRDRQQRNSHRSDPFGDDYFRPPPGYESHNKQQSAEDQEEEVQEEDCFAVLGLSAKGVGESEESVNKAFKELALKWHPDKNDGSEESQFMMRRINEAKTRAMEKVKKVNSQYDEEDPFDNQTRPEAESKAETKREKKQRKKQEQQEREKQQWEFEEEQRKMMEEARRKLEKEMEQVKKLQREQLRRSLPPEMLSKNQRRLQQKRAESERNNPTKKAEELGGPELPVRSKPRPVFEDCAHDVSCAMKVGAEEVLYRYLLAISPMEEIDEEGNNALHYAAYHRNIKFVNMIIQIAGPFWWKVVMARNKNQEYALDVATEQEADANLIERMTQLHTEAKKVKDAEDHDKKTSVNYSAGLNLVGRPAIGYVVARYGVGALAPEQLEELYLIGIGLATAAFLLYRTFLSITAHEVNKARQLQHPLFSFLNFLRPTSQHWH